MQSFDIGVPNNGTFVWTLDFSEIATVYNLSLATWRMQVKTFATDPSPLFEWATSGALGTITYSAGTNTIQIIGSESAMALISGVKSYDLRLELPSLGEIVVLFGTCDFWQGVSTSGASPNTATGATLVDTVQLLSIKQVGLMAPQPLSINNVSAAIAAAAAQVALATTAAASAAASASTAAAIAATNLGIWATRNAFAAATIPSAITAVECLGFASPGDCPRFLMVKAASEPSHPGRVQTADGAWWAISGDLVYPQQIGTVGASDDSAVLHNADLVAQAIGAELCLNKVHAITAAVTFASLVRFFNGGRLRPSATGLITFNGAFEAAEHYFIFDFSALSSGSGLATATVAARGLTPDMFGVVPNSPSSSTANAPKMQAFANAIAVSGLNAIGPPVMYYIGGPTVFDFGMTDDNGGFYFYGTEQCIFNYDAGVVSPNLKFTDLTSVYASEQRAEFYGKIDGLQVWGTPSNGGTTVGGVTFQIGEQALQSDSEAQVYFNGFDIENVVVKNDATNGGGIGTFLSGLTTCKMWLTSNAGGVYADGSSALVMEDCSMMDIQASLGNADRALAFLQGNNYGLKFSGMDIEVVNTAIYNRATQTQNNTYQGSFAAMQYVLDSTAGQGNIIGPCQYGGITQGLIANATAANGTFGGYGWTFRQANSNWLGMIIPYGGVQSTGPFALPYELVSGTWYRNIWGQDALVHFFGSSDLQVFTRDFFDSSSAGERYLIGPSQGMVVQVKAGQFFMASSASTMSVQFEVMG